MAIMMAERENCRRSVAFSPHAPSNLGLNVLVREIPYTQSSSGNGHNGDDGDMLDQEACHLAYQPEQSCDADGSNKHLQYLFSIKHA